MLLSMVIYNLGLQETLQDMLPDAMDMALRPMLQDLHADDPERVEQLMGFAQTTLNVMLTTPESNG